MLSIGEGGKRAADGDRYIVELLTAHAHGNVDSELTEATSRSDLEKTLARFADLIEQTEP